ncbi:MAG: DUF4097 family beta strand repeat-containing protein, partial [Halobacteriota archaeon]|nr:DUF4097 family beta strand repeat-containing protein [Halobacteriota archaeon]
TKHLKDWGSRVSVDISIKVPDNVEVEHVKTSNGDIEVVGVSGDTEVICLNGGITVKDIDGYVKASTENGNIEIEGTEGIGDLDCSNGDIDVEVLDIARDIEIKSKNGAIDVYLNPSINADIGASTTNGEISIDDLELVLVSSSRDEIKGKLGDGGSRIEISTENGNINLYELVFPETVEESE